MSTYITGMWAIDNCAGESSCELHCGGPACSTNGWYMSYPHYNVCGVLCNLNLGLPEATVGCGGILSPVSKCVAGPFFAYLWECGPIAGQSSTVGWCNPGGSHGVIACGTVALLTALANGANPYSYGHVFAGLYVS